MRLKDRVCLITGGGRGIGRATAIRFAQEGARVAVADVDLQVASEVAHELGERGLALELDVSSPESIEAGLERIISHWGRLDVLVNNAGILRDAQLLKMSEADFDAVIDINLKAVFTCTRAVARRMVEQGSGVILNASSVVALYGNFGQSNYVAAKAGVIGMTKVWGRELGPKGIRVNAVAPGFIQTRMTAGIPDKVVEKINERVPLRRMGSPEEVANAYLWLASDEASYVNGHVLSVDGGAVV
ncbi:SDR family oxidoreductase [bacterium CPR1]|nr:SDR family oxidoreductase [bacterium CPR1]